MPFSDVRTIIFSLTIAKDVSIGGKILVCRMSPYIISNVADVGDFRNGSLYDGKSISVKATHQSTTSYVSLLLPTMASEEASNDFTMAPKDASNNNNNNDNEVEKLREKIRVEILGNVKFSTDIEKCRKLLIQQGIDEKITNQEIQRLEKDHAPTFSTLAFFLRVAKRRTTNFNNDSIALLRTVADQLKMKPVELLLGFKSYRLSKPKGKFAPFGVKMGFAKHTNNEISTCEAAENVVASLQLTYHILEKQLNDSSSKTLIAIGRRQDPKQPEEVDFSLSDSTCYLTLKVLKQQQSTLETETDGSTTCITRSQARKVGVQLRHKSVDSLSENTERTATATTIVGDRTTKGSFKAKPVLSTHKMKSLDNRFWLLLHHRYTMMHCMAFIFGNALGDEAPIRKDESAGFVQYTADFEAYLGMSFVVSANCGSANTEGRRVFICLEALICLVYPTLRSVLADKDNLIQLWVNRNQEHIATSFELHLNQQTCILSDHEALVATIDKIFQHFRRPSARGRDYFQKQLTGPGLMTGPDLADEEWWDCIRYNVFRHYVELDYHKKLKSALTIKFNEELGDRKHDANNSDRTKVQDTNQTRKSLKRKAKVQSIKRSQRLRQMDTTSVERDEDASDMESKDSEFVPGYEDNENGGDGEVDEDDFETGSNDAKSDSEVSVHDVEVDLPKESVSLAELMEMASKEPSIERVQETSGDHSNAEESCLVPETKPASSIPILKENPREAVKTFRLALEADLIAAGVDCELIIKAEHCRYILRLAAFEFYLANRLRMLLHQRVVRQPFKFIGRDMDPKDCATMKIGARKLSFIDPANILHVARFGSAIISQSTKMPEIDLSELLTFLLEYGTVDNNRSEGLRVHAGMSGPESPNHSVGMGMETALYRNKPLRKMLGMWLRFLWDCSNKTLELAGKLPLAKLQGCNVELKEFFFIHEDEVMGFHALTLALQEIASYYSENLEHRDIPNCSLQNTSQTACTSICVVDTKTKRVYLLQMIANFRANTTAKYFPLYRPALAVTKNIESTVDSISKQMLKLYKHVDSFGGESPNALDRTNFFIDEEMDFKAHDIGGGVELELVDLPVGFSRTLSLSPCIHVIREARRHCSLERGKLIDLYLAGSLQNTTVRFYHIMSGLVERAKAGDFEFSKYPFKDWYVETKKVFGNWQGGPFPRYSSAGNTDFEKLFSIKLKKKDGDGDEDRNNDEDDEEEGNARLLAVREVLSDFLNWVDDQAGLDLPSDLPVHKIQAKLEEVHKKVKEAAGPGLKDFGLFRLQMVLQYAIGGGTVEPGRHLRQMFIPTRGLASASHLKGANDGRMSTIQATRLAQSVDGQNTLIPEPNDRVGERPIKLEEFDELMKVVCMNLNQRYMFRDFVECALCEARPDRHLNKRDVFIRGVPLYDLDDNGRIIWRPPGRDSVWQLYEIN